ncbi:hypothetical protein HanHA300_Chr02g0044031 [Helianthus annuus]|nr:hypothetical protein HanHA300_Chr02g0044031 [Helianthus annuus]KAJ0617939.1 hypothetical protein HanHA89_Chr02g0047451 [Helianthus annuus]
MLIIIILLFLNFIYLTFFMSTNIFTSHQILVVGCRVLFLGILIYDYLQSVNPSLETGNAKFAAFWTRPQIISSSSVWSLKFYGGMCWFGLRLCCPTISIYVLLIGRLGS